MSDSSSAPGAKQPQNAGANTAGSASAAAKQNPAFQAMGLPRWRGWKLPSRNWMIFLTIVGSWTAYVQYDRREKRIVQQKWARLVADLKNDTLPPNQLQRKLTIILESPPADSIIVSREHFHEYVKPVLVESGVDWDVVEGRKEGDVRAGLAEKIRKYRQMKGESSLEPLEDWEILLQDVRGRSGIKEMDGIAGDIVIGRNAWKEYVRGLHEGWLGPMDPPASSNGASASDSAIAVESVEPVSPVTTLSQATSQPPTTDPLMLNNSSDDASPTAQPTEADSPTDTPDETKVDETKEDEKPKTRKQPPPFIAPSQYSSSDISPHCPSVIGPSQPIPHPHLLGFLNFPIRIYRYLHKRHLADEIGRQTAAATLAVYRPYEGFDDAFSDPSFDFHSSQASQAPALAFPADSHDSTGSSPNNAKEGELQNALKHEEADWHKSVTKRDGDEPGQERVWLDEVVLDPRIARRMQRFVLSGEEEDRAKAIDAQIRREKWDAYFEIPARIVRGARLTMGMAPREKHPLDTVGHVEDGEVD